MLLNYEFHLSLIAELRAGLIQLLSQDSKGISKTELNLVILGRKKILFECSNKSGINNTLKWELYKRPEPLI